MITHSGSGFTPSFRSVMFLLLVLSVFVAAAPTTANQATPAAVTAEAAVAQVTSDDGVIRFDVSENATNYTWAGAPELVDGFPTVGTPFVTYGYIYPAGTLTESNGVLEDGSPEFPEKVIGHWSCYGWWIGDPAHAGQTPPWLTTHLFNFGSDLGAAMLVSEGYSIDEMNVPLERAVVGGSGHFAGVSGTQIETNLGYNASGGINVQYEIHLSE